MKRLATQLLPLALALATLASSWALPSRASAQTVAELRVEGTLRVEPEAVLRRVRLAVGDALRARDLAATMRSIYELGFFDDVRAEAELVDGEVVLTFVVTEKPSVAALVFEGNDKIDDDEILEEITLDAGSILDESAVQRAARRIGELYRDKGYLLAEVDYRIEPATTGSVDVVFEVNEFAKVQVGRVSIVGNEQLSDREITRVMQTREGNILSFLGQMGRFQEEYLQQDLMNIRVLYYDQGYLDISVGDPIVELSRDRTRVFVAVSVDEGDAYTVSSVSVSGDLLESQEDTMDRLVVEPGETFRSSRIRTDIDRLTQHYQDLGYAYANVNLLTDMNPEADEVGITYDVDRGELAYIGRIRVLGNDATRDRVIRREMAIREGDQYSRTLIRRSESWVQQLGFFESVQVREMASELGSNRIDLEVEVVERHTRSLQVGAGFSSAESFLATAQVQENNLLGRGQNLSLNAMFSAVRTMFQVSFFEPHLYDSNVALQLDVFNRQLAYRDFEETRRGGSVSFGYRPFRQHEYWRGLSLRAGYQIQDVRAESLRGFDTADTDGGLTSAITYGVSLDRRDDRLVTTSGYYVAIDNEVADAAFASDNEYYKVQGFARGYTHIDGLECGDGDTNARTSSTRRALCRWLRAWVLKANFELGYVGSLNPRRGVPRFERFYPGGPESVRGFELFTLGPAEQQALTGDPNALLSDRLLGGNKNVLFQLELEFPILDVVGIRGVMFADAGNAVDIDSRFPFRPDFSAGPNAEEVLRTALGFGFRWRSPLGMLRFEWGFPLQVREDERSSVFQFSIGPSF